MKWVLIVTTIGWNWGFDSKQYDAAVFPNEATCKKALTHFEKNLTAFTHCEYKDIKND